MDSRSPPALGSGPSLAWAALLFVLLGAVAYHGSLDVPFLFDDEAAISDNPRIESLLPFGSAGYEEQSTEAGRPVVRFSLALNYALGELEVGEGALGRALRAVGIGAGGRNPRGYHLVNLGLHVLSGVVLFALLRRTLSPPSFSERLREAAGTLALVSASLWLVHPLQVDAVTYVIQRTELIMGLFALLTLHTALRAHHSRRPRLLAGASVLCCALGMVSKEAMAAVPVLVALHDRAFVFPDWRAALSARRGLYAGLASTWAILVLVIAAGPRDETVGFHLGVPWWHYGATQLVMIAHYLRLAFWPVGLCFDYGRRLANSAEVIPAAIVVVPLVLGTLWAMVRRPRLGFAGAWFFGFLAPSSSIVPIASEVGAERRMHLPLAAILVLVVLAGHALAEGLLRRRGVGRPARRSAALVGLTSALIGVVLVGLTVRRNAVFESDLSIWLDTVARRPDNSGAHNNLGRVYAQRGRFEEALAHFEIAARMPESDEGTQDNLGKALVDLGRSEEAIAHYRALLRDHPSFWKGRVGLARAYMSLERWSEAVDEYQRCLAGGHESADLQNDLGRALFRAGRRDEAVRALERALELDPRHELARQNLAALRAQGGGSQKP